MKSLDVSAPVVNMRGVPMMKENGKPFTVQDVLLELIGSMRPQNGRHAIDLMKIGLAILEAAPIVQLEDAEVARLHEAIDTNTPNYPALVLAVAASLIE